MRLSCGRQIESEDGKEILTYFARFCVATNCDKLSVADNLGGKTMVFVALSGG
jgi:hypothetical protein